MTTLPTRPTPTATPKRPAKMSSSQSLNHLLNFTLPPRQTPPQSLPRRSKKTGNLQGVWNKERFVNAQYRFVMNPTGDYTVHFADPDIFFQWHDILQVIIPRSSALASASTLGDQAGQEEGHTICPICLSLPTAPRMTKCGHIFCFPCILHYLSMSDNLKWARCPICFDSVNEKQLKSVKWYDPVVHISEDEREFSSGASSSSIVESVVEASPRSGSLMRMRLMQRPQITTLALPRSRTWPSDLIPPHQAPFHFLPDVYTHAKFMLATPDYLILDLSKDMEALTIERRMMVSMNDELSLSFIDAAEEKLRLQIAKAAALETYQLRDAIDRALRDQQEIEDRFALLNHNKKEEAEEAAWEPLEVPDAFLATQPIGFESARRSASTLQTSIPLNSTVKSPTNAPSTNRNFRSRRNLNPPPPSTQTYYYYQAASGLPIFLHPLDIKILFSHFNSYASFPDTITVRVDFVSEGTVNDDLRKRCKYLAHMPEGADVVFIEAGLEGVVGEEGLKNFEGPLKLRRARRKEKGKKDDRARARAEERERDKIVAPRTEVISVASPVVVEEIIVPEPPPLPVVTGAWGGRSFASATASRSVPGQRAVRQENEDEWDIDIAWHEMEQRNAGGGRKKKNNKLVVLGGGGPGGGRRR